MYIVEEECIYSGRTKSIPGSSLQNTESCEEYELLLSVLHTWLCLYFVWRIKDEHVFDASVQFDLKS